MQKSRRNAHDEAACLIAKISIYLKEYVTRDVLKELDMAFVSIGQKYGFVSAGDEFRKELAEARAEAQAKAQAEEQAKAEKNKLATAQKMVRDGVISIENAISYFGYSKEQILAK